MIYWHLAFPFTFVFVSSRGPYESRLSLVLRFYRYFSKFGVTEQTFGLGGSPKKEFSVGQINAEISARNGEKPFGGIIVGKQK